MGKINMNELTKEQIQKAMACESVEELMELAKSEGVELTKEEADAYMAELDDIELNEEELKKVAGGLSYWGKCSEVCDHYCSNNFFGCGKR